MFLEVLSPKLCFQNKPFRFVQRIVFLSLLGTIWFLGSVTLIQIDYEQRESLRGVELSKSKSNHTVIQLENLSLRIDSYCRHLEERKALLYQNTDTTETESILVVENAKKEKLIRDTLIYFPELNQMWCLVPKVIIVYLIHIFLHYFGL